MASDSDVCRAIDKSKKTLNIIARTCFRHVRYHNQLPQSQSTNTYIKHVQETNDKVEAIWKKHSWICTNLSSTYVLVMFVFLGFYRKLVQNFYTFLGTNQA